MATWHLSIPHDKRPFCGPDVLCYYDGPLLFWLPVEGRRLLAVALPDEAGHWPFLVVEVTDAQALALESNQLTLRAAVLAAGARWHLRDYDAETLVLESLDSVPEAWLPGDVMLKREGA
ncbi:hypothetical protein KTD31_03615 [Burkholderia multivorans]|uniref:hypothetical protein n=1 Tax=Burkholderia multivorans TaxID=87883 RepID=UPI001C241C26|nr:hypothetical protein [Burkholderia multivorans]MBU9200442.1 hypothetical protein [Burkholderia multivorans]